MPNDFIPFIEPTPEPVRTRCKIAVWLLASSLSYGVFIVAAATWYLYDGFYGAGALIISYLVMGIIRSKLRNSAIPVEQQEYNYTDHAVAAWYVSRALLCDFLPGE